MTPSTPIPGDMQPMLAAVGPLPEGNDWSYEPKWDGFRTIVHRAGRAVELISRGARSMTRYFPEVLAAFTALGADPVVVDGELVVVTEQGLDFDALQQRIHPAESRVRLLSLQTPALFIAFDLLAEGEEDLRAIPLAARRGRLERLLETSAPPLMLTPYTRDPELGRQWFNEFEGAGLDGVIAKSWTQPYQPGRRAWVKVKHQRTCDCVVIGWRWNSDHQYLGSLLLGLYDSEGRLHYVGHTSSFNVAMRRELLTKLEPLRIDKTGPMGRMPGGPSRWSQGKDTDWEPTRPELVCEVHYEKLQSGERFRHAAGFHRWRPDKPPRECTYDQIESATAFDVARIFGPGRS